MFSDKERNEAVILGLVVWLYGSASASLDRSQDHLHMLRLFHQVATGIDLRSSGLQSGVFHAELSRHSSNRLVLKF